MYRIVISEKLGKILRKLYRKDRGRYEMTLRKMGEICECDNPAHYKSLRYDLKECSRVHINTHFVLIFIIEEKNKIVRFLDSQHHDIIYRKKY